MNSVHARITKKRTWVGAILATTLCFALVGTAGLISRAASNGHQAVSLEMGITFNLPNGYAIHQEEVNEGGYSTTISFGKAFRPNHFKDAHLQMVFWPTAYDGKRGIFEYTPSKFVEVEFERMKGSSPDGAVYISLFGNKAVRYTVRGLGIVRTVVGFLRADQLVQKIIVIPGEYQVRIRIDSWGQESEMLFNTVLNSLRTVEIK